MGTLWGKAYLPGEEDGREGDNLRKETELAGVGQGVKGWAEKRGGKEERRETGRERGERSKYSNSNIQVFRSSCGQHLKGNDRNSDKPQNENRGGSNHFWRGCGTPLSTSSCLRFTIVQMSSLQRRLFLVIPTDCSLSCVLTEL